jgi:hypothetical protein
MFCHDNSWNEIILKVIGQEEHDRFTLCTLMSLDCFMKFNLDIFCHYDLDTDICGFTAHRQVDVRDVKIITTCWIQISIMLMTVHATKSYNHNLIMLKKFEIKRPLKRSY